MGLPLVYTREQVAKVLAVTVRHVDNLTRRGLLRPVRLGRCVRYHRDSIVAALKRLEKGPAWAH